VLVKIAKELSVEAKMDKIEKEGEARERV